MCGDDLNGVCDAQARSTLPECRQHLMLCSADEATFIRSTLMLENTLLLSQDEVVPPVSLSCRKGSGG